LTRAIADPILGLLLLVSVDEHARASSTEEARSTKEEVAMASPSDINRIVTGLSEAGIVDFKRPLTELLQVPGLDVVNPAEKVGWYVVGGDHFVIVCGMGVNPVTQQNPA
jgi:hypothetical protein